MTKITATDGKNVVVSPLHSLPEKLMIFDSLDEVSYLKDGQLLTEKELQDLFNEFNINCLLL